MKTCLFYFTGTGNSKMIAEELGKALTDCTVTAVEKFDWGEKVVADAVGLVFPVYCSGIPNLMRRFLEKAALPKTAYYFTVADFGGSAGSSHAVAASLLKKRGSTLRAAFSLKMPNNYLLLFPAPSPEKQERLFGEMRAQLPGIAEAVSRKDTTRIPGGNPLVGLTNNYFRRALPEWDVNFRVGGRCISCGRCAQICPVHNISMVHGAPMWHHHCEFCLRCLQCCPREAIDYKKKTAGKKRYHNPALELPEEKKE